MLVTAPSKGSRVLSGRGHAASPADIRAMLAKRGLGRDRKPRAPVNGLALFCRWSWGPFEQGRIYIGAPWRIDTGTWHAGRRYLFVIDDIVIYAPVSMFEPCNAKRTIHFASVTEYKRFTRQSGTAVRQERVLPC